MQPITYKQEQKEIFLDQTIVVLLKYYIKNCVQNSDHMTQLRNYLQEKDFNLKKFEIDQDIYLEKFQADYDKYINSYSYCSIFLHIFKLNEKFNDSITNKNVPKSNDDLKLNIETIKTEKSSMNANQNIIMLPKKHSTEKKHPKSSEELANNVVNTMCSYLDKCELDDSPSNILQNAKYLAKVIYAHRKDSSLKIKLQ